MKSTSSGLIIRALRVILLIWMTADILFLPHESVLEQCALIGGFVLIQLNDQLRILLLKKRGKRRLTIVSLVITILGAGYYLYFLPSSFASSIYFIFPLVEMFTDESDLLYGLIAFHFCIYLLASRFNGSTKVIITLLIAYALILMILLLFRINDQAKQKSEQLNEKLREANQKLQEYSSNVRQIAIVEERMRIAQELHDAIGHGLVALGMNLEFAEHLLQSNPSKTAEAVVRAHGQSKKCMDDLRKAVNVLKQEIPVETSTLHGQLWQLLCELQSGGVTAQLEVAPKAESASAAIKTCIFKTVREAVTNGIRHGGAVSFTIKITGDEKFLRLTVQDDGAGCESINKSHGLLGMEERVAALHGSVSYPAVDSGFCLEAAIPYSEEETL